LKIVVDSCVMEALNMEALTTNTFNK